MSGLRTTWTLAWTRLRCLHKNIGQLLVLMSLTVWTPVLATAQPVILQELQIRTEYRRLRGQHRRRR